MAEVIGPLVHNLPAQLVVYERGSLAGVPPNGATITTEWYDTIRLQEEDIPVPQTGAIVSTGGGYPQGGAGAKRAGLFFLDLFVLFFIDNGDELLVNVEGIIVPGLEGAGSTIRTIARYMIPGAAVLDQVPPTIVAPQPFRRRLLITMRAFRISFFTPVAGTIQTFDVLAVLRSV